MDTKALRTRIVIGLLILMVLTAGVVILARGAFAETTDTPVQVMTIQKGDANGDGRINVQDITAIVRQLLGIDPFCSYSDANWDGKVNMLDVQKIVNIIMGRDVPVP
jgi:hypothetical protein